MPDFFEPHSPFPAEKFPPKTQDVYAELDAFFAGTANQTASLNKLVAFGHNLKADGKKKVGAYGFCWGMLLVPEYSMCMVISVGVLQVPRLLSWRGRRIRPSHHLL